MEAKTVDLLQHLVGPWDREADGGGPFDIGRAKPSDRGTVDFDGEARQVVEWRPEGGQLPVDRADAQGCRARADEDVRGSEGPVHERRLACADCVDDRLVVDHSGLQSSLQGAGARADRVQGPLGRVAEVGVVVVDQEACLRELGFVACDSSVQPTEPACSGDAVFDGSSDLCMGGGSSVGAGAAGGEQDA